MPRKESLIAAYLLDGKGGGKPIGWDEIAAWTPEQGLLWVHLDFSITRSKQWLAKSSGLDKPIVQALIADESRPRAVSHGNGLLVFLRGVNLNPGQDPEDMVSIRTWIEPNRIITTRRRKLLSIEDIRNAIKEKKGPKSPGEFLTLLSECLLNRMADVMDNIDERVDQLEQEIITEEAYTLRPKIAEIRRESIEIRRYLAPQREAFNRLYLSEPGLLDGVDKILIRESADRVIRYIEDLDSARERAAVTQEELASRLSEQMERRMYQLSVVAIIFLPLTFITGLLGINVGGIPGADNHWAFWLVCSILTVLTAGMAWWFYRRKWL